jgi:hypothetical protein
MLGVGSLLLRSAARALRAVKTDGGARASEADSGPTATNAPQDERSITTMRTTRILMLSLLAVFAFSAVAAGAAQADPYWIVKCHEVSAANKAESRWEESKCEKSKAGGGFDTRLFAGETRKTTSKKVSTVFKLKTSLLTIECTGEKATGAPAENEIIGGWPGTDKSEVIFEGCHVEGKTVETCGAATAGKEKGIIGPFKVKTLLGFPVGEPGGTKEAYDQFFPTPSETEFTSFVLTGTACGALKEYKVKVLATGTKAVVMGTPLCGVIARVGKIVEEKFVVTKSGEVAEKGGLEFPTTAITEEKVWNPTTKEYEVVKCGLQAQINEASGKLVGTVTAVEAGVALVELEPKEPFGWEA